MKSKSILFAILLAGGALAPHAQAKDEGFGLEISARGEGHGNRGGDRGGNRGGDRGGDRGGHNGGNHGGNHGPGRPGPGPGFGHGPGRPGPGPGFGHGPGRPGPGPGFGHRPGRPGPGPGFGHGHRPGRPGWRPGHRPSFRPGWGHRRDWHRPHRWRPVRRHNWFPPIFIPVPMPSEGWNSICEGTFVGSLGERDAYMNLDEHAGAEVRGSLTLTDPEASFVVRGTCQDNGDSAEVTITLNGGRPYVGQIYVADDGETYFEGEQEGSPVSFQLQRRSE